MRVVIAVSVGMCVNLSVLCYYCWCLASVPIVLGFTVVSGAVVGVVVLVGNAVVVVVHGVLCMLRLLF